MQIVKHFLSYSWLIVTNLVAVAIAITALGRATSEYEVTVLSLLILVYIAVVSTAGGLGITLIKTLQGVAGEFSRMRKLLKDTASNEETEALEKIEKDVMHLHAKFVITTVFLSIIWIVIVYRLIFPFGI